MRRTATLALGVLAITSVVTAAPAWADPPPPPPTLQTFVLAIANGRQVATARGEAVNGVGTFTRVTNRDEVLQFPDGEVRMTNFVGARTESVDGRTCRITGTESGGFMFAKTLDFGALFGSGGYTLSSVATGHRLPGGGCDTSSPTASTFSLTARATELHVSG